MVKYDNGRIPDEDLIEVQPNRFLPSHTADPFLAMEAHARRDGITLTLNDAYRSITRQVALFVQNYTTTPQNTRPTKRWANKTWYRKPSHATTAVPATSNHGWGNAIDVANCNSGFGNAPTKVYAWLAKHSAYYGWTNPNWAKLPAFYEPWHWEYDPLHDQYSRDKANVEVKYFNRGTKKVTREATNKWLNVIVGDNGSDLSVINNAAGAFTSVLTGKVEGLKDGDRVMVRAVRVKKDAKGKWVTSHTYPSANVPVANGVANINATQIGKINKDQRLRWQFVAPVGAKFSNPNAYSTVAVA